jgi:translocation and assembly module TamA
MAERDCFNLTQSRSEAVRAWPGHFAKRPDVVGRRQGGMRGGVSGGVSGIAIAKGRRSILLRMRRFAARRWSTAVLLAILFHAAAPSVSRAADPQPYTVELKATGDTALDAAMHDSATLISLKDKSPVGGFALTQRALDDADRFRTAAWAFGYYNATVTTTIGGTPLDDSALVDMIDKAPASPSLPIVVRVERGQRYRIGQIAVDFTTSGAIPPNVVAALGLKQGQDAVAADVLAARDRLLTAMREASFPLATVTLDQVDLHPDQAEMDVRFQIAPGARADLGQIQFNGLRDMSEAFMRQRLLLRPGQPFSPSAIEKARQDLLALGVFSSVRIVPAETLDPAGNLPLAIDLEERKLHAVDVGAGYSTDLGVNLNLAWHHRDLFGGAEQLNLTAAVQLGGDATTKPGGQLGAQFIKPDFMRRDQTLELDLNAVDQSLIAYDQRALIQSASVTRKLSEHWSVTGGVLTEEEDITQEGVERAYEFAGVPFTVKYDSTNSLLDPVSGIRASVSLTPAHSFAGGGALYLIAQASGSTYFDLTGNGRSVIAVRGLVAQISGTGVFGLPPDQRLYAGGSGSVRGFRYQSVGPLFADGKPTGGTAMSAGTVEFRQRFLENWGAAAFIDSGQASGDGKPFTSDWRTGVGVGLRYYTSIGPIRVDFAMPVTRVPGGDSFEFYIGIGQAF